MMGIDKDQKREQNEKGGMVRMRVIARERG